MYNVHGPNIMRPLARVLMRIQLKGGEFAHNIDRYKR